MRHILYTPKTSVRTVRPSLRNCPTIKYKNCLLVTALKEAMFACTAVVPDLLQTCVMNTLRLQMDHIFGKYFSSGSNHLQHQKENDFDMCVFLVCVCLCTCRVLGFVCTLVLRWESDCQINYRLTYPVYSQKYINILQLNVD